MKFPKILILAFMVLFLWSFNSFATPINDNGYEDSLQEILDNITLGGPSSVDASGDVNDALTDDMDSYWTINATGGSISTFIIELTAGASNQTFGIFDIGNESNRVEIFAGVDNGGEQVLLSMLADGSIIKNFGDTGVDFHSYNFGYYLTSGNNTFYSQTDLNADQFDHMVAFQGAGDMVQIQPYAPGPWSPGEYVLAWEDAFGGGDADYQDMVVMVESVTPVPEPATMLLLGSGLVGLAGFGRKRFFKKG